MLFGIVEARQKYHIVIDQLARPFMDDIESMVMKAIEDGQPDAFIPTAMMNAQQIAAVSDILRRKGYDINKHHQKTDLICVSGWSE